MGAGLARDWVSRSTLEGYREQGSLPQLDYGVADFCGDPLGDDHRAEDQHEYRRHLTPRNIFDDAEISHMEMQKLFSVVALYLQKKVFFILRRQTHLF
ncbi:MAG: hypothetical protein WBJ75_06205 [Pseudohongiellaceae bacterium]